MRSLLLSTALVLSFAGADALAAGDFGSAEEAKAMLERAVAAVQEDKDAALSTFTAGGEGFKDRDLYVFCGDMEGNFTAHGANAALIGQSLKGLEDKAGTPLGETIYAEAIEGEYHVVEYMWPRPGETDPSQKASYVTKVADQVCAVGYYR